MTNAEDLFHISVDTSSFVKYLFRPLAGVPRLVPWQNLLQSSKLDRLGHHLIFSHLSRFIVFFDFHVNFFLTNFKKSSLLSKKLLNALHNRVN